MGALETININVLSSLIIFLSIHKYKKFELLSHLITEQFF